MILLRCVLSLIVLSRLALGLDLWRWTSSHQNRNKHLFARQSGTNLRDFLFSKKIDYSQVPVPSRSETERWVANLGQIPEEGAADVTSAVDYAIRFSALVYSRNDGRSGQIIKRCGMDQSGQETGIDEMVEVQFHAPRDVLKNTHANVYLYKLSQGGVGAVVVYRGTTSLADWGKNIRILGSHKASRAAPEVDGKLPEHALAVGSNSSGNISLAQAKVHMGFLRYKRGVDRLMAQFHMEPLRAILSDWGAPTDAPTLQTWLLSGDWTWCVCAGHSLGGSAAAIAAVEIAAHSGKKPFLATVAQPSTGNNAFYKALSQSARPGGGLLIRNEGDIVPWLGLHAIKHNQVGREVLLEPRMELDRVSPYHVHTRYRVVSGDAGPVTFFFPGVQVKLRRGGLDGRHKRTSLLGKVRNAKDSLQDKVLSAKDSLQGKVLNATSSLQGKVLSARVSLQGKVMNATNSLQDKVLSARDSLQGKVMNATNSLQGKVLSARDSLQRKVMSAKDSLQGKVLSARDSLQEKVLSAEEKLTSVISYRASAGRSANPFTSSHVRPPASSLIAPDAEDMRDITFLTESEDGGPD